MGCLTLIGFRSMKVMMDKKIEIRDIVEFVCNMTVREFLEFTEEIRVKFKV